LYVYASTTHLATIARVAEKDVKLFDIKQPVYFADIFLEDILAIVSNKKIIYREVSKFPSVERDLAFIISNRVNYQTIESTIKNKNLPNLKTITLI